LLGKSEPLTPRYFSPEAAPPPKADTPAARAPLREGAELRLGRINAAAYLDERIVFRDSEYELGFYEDRRWTESPEAYLRRALSRSLFEDYGVRRIVSGPGPSLDVELTEFAELKRSPAMARVRLTYTLSDDRLVRREATVSVELPIAASGTEADAAAQGVRAMSRALSKAVQQIVDQVVDELRRAPAPHAVTQSQTP
jgi:cholesterol transport system auxiliary component